MLKALIIALVAIVTFGFPANGQELKIVTTDMKKISADNDYQTVIASQKVVPVKK